MATATVVAGERPLPDVAIGALREAGPQWGAGEYIAFDRAASAKSCFAWLLRSERDFTELTSLLSVIAEFADLDSCSWYAVEARDAHGAAAPTVTASPVEVTGVRKVTFHRRLPDITFDDYVRRFHDHGAIAAVHHANATRYRQNVVTRFAGPAGRAADGISEHWYASLSDATDRHFARPDSRAVVAADVMEWLDVSTAVAGYGKAWTWC